MKYPKKISITLSFLGLFGLLLTMSGCLKDLQCINGNGSPIVETRFPSSFHEIVNNGSFEVRILPGNSPEIRIDAESNLLQYIRTVVSGNRLIIETENNRCINNSLPMLITVFVPYVDAIELNGSGYISAYDLYLDDLYLNLNGSGKIDVDADVLFVRGTITGSGVIEISGIAETGDFNISGSGNIYGYEIAQQKCYATISGSGNMYMQVSELLDAVISGSGNIYYRGNPSVIQRITGSGRIIRQ